MDFCIPSALSSTAKSDIPTVGTRSTLDSEVATFLKQNPGLHLGGKDKFTAERAEHLKIFGFHSLDSGKRSPIQDVEFTAVRGPHGTIPIRLFYTKSGQEQREKKDSAALIYFHGGGYTVGSVDEFENGLRIVAEESGAVVVGVEYRLAPEWSFPVQLDEYDAVIDWAQGNEGRKRGISSEKVCGGGDSAGGNMTAAVTLRRKDNGRKPFKAQLLLYPEARLPFDTKAAVENNSGYYLECNGIFSFADHYATRGVPPIHRYISPGMQMSEDIKDLPSAAVFTCGFDPLRDVGVEYAHLLQKAGNTVHWSNFDSLTHGFLQLAPWS
ncbi:hypothetical protein IL306_008788 [Fusarium sp. DS 682]|nr:hypothetical protein IL306_008788 [Fusarium sp. DS 682]